MTSKVWEQRRERWAKWKEEKMKEKQLPFTVFVRSGFESRPLVRVATLEQGLEVCRQHKAVNPKLGFFVEKAE